MLATSMQPARLRDASAVRGRSLPLSRVLVPCRCSSTGLPNAPQQQPPKPAPKPLRAGLVSIAHLRIDTINVHLTSSALPQDLASTLQSAVTDAATAAVVAAPVAPSREPEPVSPAPPFTCIGQFESPNVHSLAMCCDGHRFVCGYEEGDVALWDLRKPNQRVVADLGNEGFVQSVAASADCARILVGSSKGLWLWDVAQGTAEALIAWDALYEKYEEKVEDVWDVAITPDGRYGVSGGHRWGLRVWDLDKRECIDCMATTGGALRVVVSPDGQTAAAVVEALGDNEVWRWHAGCGFSKLVKLQGCPQGRRFSMSVDGGVVLSVDNEGVVQRWDGQSGKAEAIFTQPGKVSRLALSHDGRRAVLSTKEGVVSVWDVESKACLGTLRGHRGGGVDAVAISVDGRHAVSNGYRDGGLCIWYLG